MRLTTIPFLTVTLATSLALAHAHSFSEVSQPGSEQHSFASASPGADSGDAVRGKAIFQRRCTGCHSLDHDVEGPRLGGVYGRHSGEIPGFDYSPGLKNAHILWNASSLNQWLTDPDVMVPNNNMNFRVIKPEERRDLIRFLQQNSEK